MRRPMKVGGLPAVAGRRQVLVPEVLPRTVSVPRAPRPSVARPARASAYRDDRSAITRRGLLVDVYG